MAPHSAVLWNWLQYLWCWVPTAALCLYSGKHPSVGSCLQESVNFFFFIFSFSSNPCLILMQKRPKTVRELRSTGNYAEVLRKDKER